MAMMTRAGGCQCGAIRFTVTGAPVRVGLCHCTDCRRYGGSAFSFFAIWPRSAYEATGETSTYAGRSFCGTCGSRVASLRDDEAEIMVGSLDEAPSDLIPEYELWVFRREGWMGRLPWADQFRHDRTDGGGDWRQPRSPDG